MRATVQQSLARLRGRRVGPDRTAASGLDHQSRRGAWLACEAWRRVVYARCGARTRRARQCQCANRRRQGDGQSSHRPNRPGASAADANRRRHREESKRAHAAAGVGAHRRLAAARSGNGPSGLRQLTRTEESGCCNTIPSRCSRPPSERSSTSGRSQSQYGGVQSIRAHRACPCCRPGAGCLFPPRRICQCGSAGDCAVAAGECLCALLRAASAGGKPHSGRAGAHLLRRLRAKYHRHDQVHLAASRVHAACHL